MSSKQPPASKLEADRRLLVAAQEKGRLATTLAYMRLSGPGWLQSAITLGGGSLAGSLYLGVVAGFAFLWVQPVAMILGIVMLSGIAYVTLSTGERPFQAINKHVNPVLGWGWALASLAANMFWCLPQYSLATSVMEQNLLPGALGANGSINTAAAEYFGSEHWLAANAAKLLIVGGILLLTTIVTWSYDSGRWGIKLYEWILKLMVAGIVVCFFGVIYALRDELAWRQIAWGFLPDLTKLFEPSDEFLAVLDAAKGADVAYWKDTIVSQQREVIIGAAATAVGINMTFLFPYSLLAKRWTREFRGLAVFDLSTGMFIPFVLATSCVVMAAANSFHTRPVEGFFDERDETSGALVVPDAKDQGEYYGMLAGLLEKKIGQESFAELKAADDALQATLPEAQRAGLSADAVQKVRDELGTIAVRAECDQLPEDDRRIAAMLIHRQADDLATALAPLTGNKVANLIFGLGVLGMTISTITLLMLISGFVVVEIFGLPEGGWPHRLGCLAAATGVLGPFVWGKASFYLAVYVSAFGLMLLPLAYLSFLLLMNRPKLLGKDMPTGGRRLVWNVLLLISAGVAGAASIYTVRKNLGMPGIYTICAFLGLALLVQIGRWIGSMRRGARAEG